LSATPGVDTYQFVLAAPAAPDAVPRTGGPVVPVLKPGAVVLVIDVLRATTVLSEALANGAAGVIEAATVDEAFALGARHPGSLLCGERDNRVVPGFDLGNSPYEYTRERVSGRTLVFASTNGSQALRLAAGRRRVLASFRNLTAAAERVRDTRDVVIVCSGKLGRFSLEDVACGAMVAARLETRGASPADPASAFARTLAPRDADDVRRVVEGSSHGRYLRTLGAAYARDVAFCSELDTLDQAFEI
jgi:2-phosphosulfolactate phosphatase